MKPPKKVADKEENNISDVIKVLDLQEFDYEDFEFIQKLQAPR
jgi:hypothetical protein